MLLLSLFLTFCFSLSHEILWEKCIDLNLEQNVQSQIPMDNKICVGVYAIPENLTVGYELRWNDHEEDFNLVSLNSYCLSDKSLIELITYIPILVPFKVVIDEAISLYKKIPADIFSLCLTAENLDVNIENREAQGDVEFDATIMCVSSHCIFKKDMNLGHFDVHIPTYDESIESALKKYNQTIFLK